MVQKERPFIWCCATSTLQNISIFIGVVGEHTLLSIVLSTFSRIALLSSFCVVGVVYDGCASVAVVSSSGAGVL